MDPELRSKTGSSMQGFVPSPVNRFEGMQSDRIVSNAGSVPKSADCRLFDQRKPFGRRLATIQAQAVALNAMINKSLYPNCPDFSRKLDIR